MPAPETLIPPPAELPLEIEVGAIKGDLRYWRAKKAIIRRRLTVKVDRLAVRGTSPSTIRSFCALPALYRPNDRVANIVNLLEE